ncbi:flagellar basal body rod protein FlgC [Paracoccus sediminicola]|uniref:flagellar basal body rod protein FlgC n=1 Tax=Paracoccus sediminicola TaxID=3017783 RepID=UPI0022F12AE9|nr:flagellar basal body rod protein FlgC [Paracoccus sediminicola]WBU56933.1 flagellar basal body rod protein FlgC [Paracoccus sediminicola]
MDQIISARQIAASGMRAQADRLRHVSENIANLDTPGYRRKLVSFEAIMSGGRQTGQVAASRPFLDRSALSRIYDPAHPMADAQGFYSGSNVDLVTEIADAREASRSYEANLKMFEQSRRMSASLLELLRR